MNPMVRISCNGHSAESKIEFDDGVTIDRVTSVDIKLRANRLAEATLRFDWAGVDILAEPKIPVATLDRLAFAMGYRLVKIQDAETPAEEPTAP